MKTSIETKIKLTLSYVGIVLFSGLTVYTPFVDTSLFFPSILCLIGSILLGTILLPNENKL